MLFVGSLFSPVVTTGQHYIFIEADGQQPFYVKRADTLYSSSASGFLIIPKVPRADFSIVLGFPKAIYPEAIFDIKDVKSDRGFHLKLFEGKGWGLFDRTSMEVIYSNGGLSERKSADSIKKTASPFAALLSDATGDDVLLEQKPVAAKKQEAREIVPVQPTEVVAVQPTKEQSIAPANMIKSEMPTLVKVSDLETDKEKIITYVERKSGGSVDTVIVKIDKLGPTDVKTLEKNLSSGNVVMKDDTNVSSESTTPASTPKVAKALNEPEPSVVRKLSACLKPAAETKDMLNLQKKLLGMAKEDEQLIYIEKIFGLKCFTSKQAIEIASFFLNENSRMNYFKRVYWLVSDHDELRQAGTLLFKEENIRAFKQLQSGN